MTKSQQIDDSPMKAEKDYIENIWTNNDGKIDGYTFKGKRSFGKALLGLKSIMIKGQQNEIGNMKFTALDTRIQGIGVEIDVQITNNNNRGIAVLKIYGPKEDIKKDNTVTVSKFKQSDSKFIVLLAEKVIVPLMDKFLSGEMEILSPETNIDGSAPEPKQFKCSFCEKICKSAKGLKSHTTKMHLDIQNKDDQKEDMRTDQKKRKITDEVFDVVESLLAEVIDKSENEVTTEEIVKIDKDTKKYTKMCNSCDFQVEANKKYINIQKILEHKDMCNFKIICPQCDKKFNDNVTLKRHMRNEHSIASGSTSPPLKKKKVDEKLASNLNDSVEEMETDDNNLNQEEVLSKMMDEKVIAKQKKDDVEVQEFLKKKDERKLKEEESILERKRYQTKLKKQKNKSNQKQNKSRIPNIKDIPEDCKGLFNDEDVVYIVPGDGACGPNSAAAHLFGDEVFGPKLRKQMNLFWADHYYEKYISITPCSAETPFRRNIKGKQVEFYEPEKLIEFLKTSDEAQYMWSDSEDLVVLSDMYQMSIKIITRNRRYKNPTVSWIHPDKNLAKHAELKDVEIDTLILLHEDESHFNLVVSKYSDLAKYGSLSFRNNLGPILNTENQENDLKNNTNKETIEKDENNDKESYSEILALKKELKACQDSKKKLEKSYNDCEKELRNKTEEVEKLKVELKDLQQIIDLEQIILEEKSTSKEHIDEAHTEKQFTCEECKFPAITKEELKKHMSNRHANKIAIGEKSDFKTTRRYKVHSQANGKHSEEEFNCDGCDFQATTQLQLNKHTNLKHRNKGQELEDVIHCKHCEEQFSEIWNLMKHRKVAHRNTVAFCKNKLADTCRFNSESCWWRHEAIDGEQQNTGRVECYICNKTFEAKGDMMIHRKQMHINIVKMCKNFQQNSCSFRDQFCWYRHDDNGMEVEDDINLIDDVENIRQQENNSVFRNATKDLKPPLLEKQQNKN